jgi:hypothetical protein
MRRTIRRAKKTMRRAKQALSKSMRRMGFKGSKGSKASKMRRAKKGKRSKKDTGSRGGGTRPKRNNAGVSAPRYDPTPTRRVKARVARDEVVDYINQNQPPTIDECEGLPLPRGTWGLVAEAEAMAAEAVVAAQAAVEAAQAAEQAAEEARHWSEINRGANEMRLTPHSMHCGDTPAYDDMFNTDYPIQ